MFQSLQFPSKPWKYTSCEKTVLYAANAFHFLDRKSSLFRDCNSPDTIATPQREYFFTPVSRSPWQTELGTHVEYEYFSGFTYVHMYLNIPQVYLMSNDMYILSICVHLLITTTYAIQIFYNIVDSKWQGSHLTHILIWSTAFFFMLIHIYICTHAFVMSVISLVLLLYLCLLLVFQSCLCILFVWNLYPILKWFLLSSN